MKIVDEIIEFKPGKTSTGKDNFSIRTKKNGYFSGFMLDYVSSPTFGVESLGLASLPARAEITYTEKPNLTRPEFPYKNISAIYILSENSEFPQINPKEQEEALDEHDDVVKLKLVANDHEKRLKVLEKFLTE